MIVCVSIVGSTRSESDNSSCWDLCMFGCVCVCVCVAECSAMLCERGEMNACHVALIWPEADNTLLACSCS